MSKTNFEIANLISRAFGLNTPTYVLPTEAPKHGALNYGNIPTQPLEAAKKLSWLGTPIIYPMVFKGGEYNQYAPTGKLTTTNLNSFDIPPATLVDFRRAKNISKTHLGGNNGTVKEVYGFDDWQIRIRGLCLDTPDMSAYEQHQELLKWEQLADSIEIQGELFLDKNIYMLVIEDMVFNQLEGAPNIIPFEITAVSDEPIELIL